MKLGVSFRGERPLDSGASNGFCPNAFTGYPTINSTLAKVDKRLGQFYAREWRVLAPKSCRQPAGGFEQGKVNMYNGTSIRL